MLKYLIVILSDSSVSFCNYESGRKDNFISYDNLKKAVVHALKNNLNVNFLYPSREPAKKFRQLIEDVEHIKIVPPGLHGRYENSITVLESSDLKNLPAGFSGGNVILRLNLREINILPAAIKKLLRRCSRINLVIKNPENAGGNEIALYRKSLAAISGNLLKESKRGILPEINFITDRLVLDKMNNCEAGLAHLTAAPDGKLYLCPAFYFEGNENSIGEISADAEIKNRRLLETKYSPVCRICDAYQCKRCVYLNRKLTGELNIPSKQQCVISHAEREAARLFLGELKKAGFPGAANKEISEIDYDDPFEKAVKNKYSIQEFKNFQHE